MSPLLTEHARWRWVVFDRWGDLLARPIKGEREGFLVAVDERAVASRAPRPGRLGPGREQLLHFGLQGAELRQPGGRLAPSMTPRDPLRRRPGLLGESLRVDSARDALNPPTLKTEIVDSVPPATMPVA